ncbi:MAG TPA: rhodanese-like domain-containing protein [Thermoanaerobaculia bacterium]|nr:rhodanese-like domain-containing protein [Thermoanaerobaculia bacterium]
MKTFALRLLAAGSLLLSLGGCETVGLSYQEGGFAEVRATVAHEMILDSQQVVVLDLRPTDEYWGPFGHIAGALPVPMGSIEKRLPALLPYKDSTILVYGDSEDESRTGCRILVAAGFNSVVRIRGGIREWIELGYPTVKPPEVR